MQPKSLNKHVETTSIHGLSQRHGSFASPSADFCQQSGCPLVWWEKKRPCHVEKMHSQKARLALSHPFEGLVCSAPGGKRRPPRLWRLRVVKPSVANCPGRHPDGERAAVPRSNGERGEAGSTAGVLCKGFLLPLVLCDMKMFNLCLVLRPSLLAQGYNSTSRGKLTLDAQKKIKQLL